ncbi:MCE family protein [Nocardioides jiangxiensis]|uniref:MCE family protein n=1 Tax=Nocardioides jiangxiensis TaxID=3064524 RepID=A0ABT9B8N2_9ACTN|nr:MCE family protein [Nocardioides sp. WY-20]MDO7869508.1 MCE family protein [Nocardioides sp. WY-20]
MKPIYQYDKYRTGLVAVGALAMLVALVIGASRLNIGARGYAASLANTGGLRAGEPVQVAGVDVGKVTSIALAGDKVDIKFTVDKDIKLGDQTRLEVKVATLLGTHFLAVVPGGAGDIGDKPIPVSQTRVPFNLQDVIEQGTPEVNAFDVDKIEKSLNSMAQLLNVAGADVKPALQQVGALSALVAKRSDDLGDLLKATSEVSRQLTDSSDDIIALMKASDLILDTLNSRRAAIHRLLADVSTLFTQLNGIVQDNRADLGPILHNLNLVIGTLKASDKTIGRAVDNLAIAGRYVSNATGGGPWVNLSNPGGLLPDAASCGRGILC